MINGFLDSYTQINSSFYNLKREVDEARKTEDRAHVRRIALELRLKQKIGAIPDKYIRYYAEKRETWNTAQRDQFIVTSSKKLGMDIDEFRTRIEELANELKEAVK